MLLKNKSKVAGRVGERRGKTNRVHISGTVNLWICELQLPGTLWGNLWNKPQITFPKEAELVSFLNDKNDRCYVLRSNIVPGALPK